jgi:hypothetical protein
MDFQCRGPPAHSVLRAAASGWLQRSRQRVDDATGRLSALETTARATATDCNDADDLADCVHAHDAGSSGRCRPLGRYGELGRVRGRPLSLSRVIRSLYRLAPLPISDDCSPWSPGSSGDGALASIAFVHDG